MGRAFPRFLLSKSTQAKSKGTFIVHTLDPAFIAEPTFNDVRQIIDIHIVKAWQDGTFYADKAREIADSEIPKWWKYSGIYDSTDPVDQLIGKLQKLDFLRDYENPYTTEEAQEIIKIIFPTKSKAINRSTTSYGIKHDLERISRLFMTNNNHKKYCSNDTIKEAFINEGFKTKEDHPNSPNINANISEHDLSVVKKISTYRYFDERLESAL